MAFEYSPKEFIKMYRKFLNWQWYTDTNTKALFIHCLLRANWKAGEWKGIHYNAGELVTSLPSLAEELGLSIHQVRVALNHLISSGELSSRCIDEVTGKKTPKARIITVNNWNKYQGNGRQVSDKTSDKVSGKRQASVRQVAVDKEVKKEKELKNIKEPSPPDLPFGNLGGPDGAGDDDDESGLMDFSDPEVRERWVEEQHAKADR